MTIRRKVTHKIAIILVAFCCAYGIRWGLNKDLRTSHRYGYLRLLLGIPKTPPTEKVDYESSLFLESILSIIQNYYVDQERVSPKELALGAISALSKNKLFSIDTKIDKNAISLTIADKVLQLPLSNEPTFEDVSTFFQSLEKIADQHKISLKPNNLKISSASFTSTLIDGVLKSLDAHSSILTPEAYLELRQGTEGSFGGLGVLVGIKNETLTVLKPIPGSPAFKAGIRKNDQILSINGHDTFGKSLDSLVEYMRGEPGSLVRLSLLRSGARAPTDMKIRREIVQVDSIETKEVGVGKSTFLHIKVENFAARTAIEVRQAIAEFRAKKSGLIAGLVLDLRDNPGGLLDQAVEVADIFLPSGIIVSTKGRREEIETAISDQDETNYPIVVLIDEDSASASEIVAGALQDHSRAVIIGQPSFGKGSVQTIFELPNDQALKLTIARYYTPSGRSIQNTGIRPDIWIQPLTSSDQNINLLGPQRYRNERFLSHHLDVQTDEIFGAQNSQRKAYYLTNKSDQDIEFLGSHLDDQELNLALKILSKVFSIYGPKLPSSASRASHWLALSGPEVSRKLSMMDREVTGWLNDKHHISWAKNPRSSVEPDLSFDLDDSVSGEAEIDSNLVLKWSLKNKDRSSVHRVSVFVRSEDSDFDTQEILVGTILPGETVRGSLIAPLSPRVKSSSMTLNLGVVVDGTPVPYLHAEHLIQIRDKPLAKLNADLDLADEKGGSLSGILEQGEKARLSLKVTNNGSSEATGLKVDFINLSGKQLDIKKLPQSTFNLKPGTSTQLTVGIDMAQMIVSPEISLGVFIDGKNIKEPLRQKFTLKSQPSRPFSAEKSSFIGH